MKDIESSVERLLESNSQKIREMEEEMLRNNALIKLKTETTKKIMNMSQAIVSDTYDSDEEDQSEQDGLSSVIIS